MAPMVSPIFFWVLFGCTVALAISLILEKRMAARRTRDLADRKKAVEESQGALRELRDLKAALDEHAIVAITDQRGKINYVNDKFCAISQYTREELIGQDHRIINSGYHPKAFFANLWTTIGHGRVWKGEIKNQAKDGSFYWVDTTIVPYLGDDGKPVQYIAIRADITERKKAEEALRHAQQTLLSHATNLEQIVALRTAELREKIGELEAFSYSVSHDMRQPLRSMQGYARILLTDYGGELDEEPRRYLERIKASANRLDRLIRDVLTYSRTTRVEGALAAIDLGQIVHEIIEAYPVLRDVDVRIEIAAGEARVLANEVALTQCLSNLLANGVKFVRNGQPPKLRLWSEPKGAYRRLWVQDNGIGIATADQERIFDIFARVNSDESYEGTGIGLSIVKKAVEKMGGKVGLVSEVGQGSRFWIDLQNADARLVGANESGGPDDL
jgi:PAS domain S-box-containing protein